jgi:predicted RNA-binding protein with PIN domain
VPLPGADAVATLAYDAGMLYLVDGYNVTHSDPATASLAIEEQRDRLIARMRVRGRELLGSGRIVVVFDGAEGVGLANGGAAPVDVRFSRGESADDLIVRIATGAAGKVCLVTSDRDLADRVRAVASGGTEVRGRESVYESASGSRKRRGTGGGRDAGSLGVPPGGRRITEELEKLWLDEENEG